MVIYIESVDRHCRTNCIRVTDTYLHPFKEDLVRFDFEVDEKDEYMCIFNGIAQSNGISLD